MSIYRDLHHQGIGANVSQAVPFSSDDCGLVVFFQIQILRTYREQYFIILASISVTMLIEFTFQFFFASQFFLGNTRYSLWLAIGSAFHVMASHDTSVD